MPQLLKSFKPQLVNTSDTSAVLFIQTFLTNPQTAIQDTIDQVKPDNLSLVNIYFSSGNPHCARDLVLSRFGRKFKN